MHKGIRCSHCQKILDEHSSLEDLMADALKGIDMNDVKVLALDMTDKSENVLADLSVVAGLEDSGDGC